MPLINELYTALLIVTGVNVIASLSLQYTRMNLSSTKVEPKEDDNTTWIWKDTVWLILMLVAAVLFAAIALFALSAFKNKLLITIVTTAYSLELVSKSIPSAKTVGNIIRSDVNKTLVTNDYIAMITLALLVNHLNAYGISDKIAEYANQQTNSILSDWILFVYYVASIAITTFLISSLALRPIKIVIDLLSKGFSYVSKQKEPILFNKLKKQINGRYDTKTRTATIIENIIKQRSVSSYLFLFVVPIAVILDVLRIALTILYTFVVSIIWCLLYITIVIGKIISKIAKWILSLSDSKVVGISFRISVILGFGSTVIINQYQPFLSNSGSASAFEFISSAIIIPVILEWILSYKSKMSKIET